MKLGLVLYANPFFIYLLKYIHLVWRFYIIGVLGFLLE
jgi:hypothetical protein